MAVALWITGPRQVALRAVDLPEPGPGEVRVETLVSAVSRGTERLVLEGRVPAARAAAMRCPFQEGDFPFPVKYGYMTVGRVGAGPAELLGRTVFALAPHQSAHVLPAAAVVPVPEGLPAHRAVLAANMETALTVVWDAGIQPGDRVVVIGAGVIGLLIARIAARIAGTDVVITDIDPAKAGPAAALDLAFAAPEAVAEGADVVINASASEAGLVLALSLAGLEATVVEASWHGDRSVRLPLGEAFHDRRLKLISSQVGRIPAGRSPRWTGRRRMETALRLLDDPKVDVLITTETTIHSVVDDYIEAMDDAATLALLIRY